MVVFNVPLSWVRPDTICQRHADQNYAVLHDPMSSSPEEREPVLQESASSKCYFGNLTFGDLASDRNPPSIRWKDLPDLSEAIITFCRVRKICQQRMPNVSESVDLVHEFVELTYGRALAHLLLLRIYKFISSHIFDADIPLRSGTQRGGSDEKVAAATMMHFAQQGFFDNPAKALLGISDHCDTTQQPASRKVYSNTKIAINIGQPSSTTDSTAFSRIPTPSLPAALPPALRGPSTTVLSSESSSRSASSGEGSPSLPSKEGSPLLPSREGPPLWPSGQIYPSPPSEEAFMSAPSSPRSPWTGPIQSHSPRSAYSLPATHQSTDHDSATRHAADLQRELYSLADQIHALPCNDDTVPDRIRSILAEFQSQQQISIHQSLVYLQSRGLPTLRRILLTLESETLHSLIQAQHDSVRVQEEIVANLAELHRQTTSMTNPNSLQRKDRRREARLEYIEEQVANLARKGSEE